MQVDEPGYEDQGWDKYDEEEWYQEENKGSSSKCSSFIFVGSTKGSPPINKVEEPAEAKEPSPRKEGDLTYTETLKMVM